MESSELTALLTPDGLRMLAAMPAVRTSDDVARQVSALRAAGHSPDLVSALVGQARLRTKAEAKFGALAQRMLFTRAGLEQATRMSIASLHAGRFRAGGLTRVADLGCGIGGDALGFAGLGLSVDAVDADEITAAIAAYNLAPFGDAVTVAHGRAEASDLTRADGIWLDPARRTPGRGETSRTNADEWSPSLDWVFDIARTRPVGVKLGPGLDRDRIPDDVEAQYPDARVIFSNIRYGDLDSTYDVPTGNVCAPETCNVCDFCCESYLNTQASCDGCFNTKPPYGCGGKERSQDVRVPATVAEA